MPSLQDQLKRLLPAWEEEQSKIEQAKQINQNPKATMQQVTTRHLFKPTNNASRETFNAVRDFPNQQPSFYADMLSKKGFKHNTIRSLIYQMTRQKQFHQDISGALTTVANAYVPIKAGKPKTAKPKQAEVTAQPAAGIAALPPQDKPAPRKATHSLIINHTWDAQKEVDKLSVMQARALYDLLKTIFGGVDMHDKKYGWPTTRRYPRTTKEAFPNDIENAQWWFPPEQRWQDKVFFWVAVAMWVVVAVYLWRTA